MIRFLRWLVRWLWEIIDDAWFFASDQRDIYFHPTVHIRPRDHYQQIRPEGKEQ